LNATRHAQAAQALWDAWSAGQTLPALPAPLRPREVSGGYAIQAQLDGLVGPRVGWKIAATGAGGRAALGVEHPLAGPLFERFAVPAGGDVDFSTIRMRTIEAEFGFAISSDLPVAAAPFDRAAVLDALGAFVPAIEIPNTRYDDHRAVGGPQLVADAACAGVFVLGEPVERYDPDALPSWPITLTTRANGTAEGRGAKVLGDPVEAVRWLANELATHGRALQRGDTVITGAAVAVREPGPGPAVADFGDLGSLTVRLT
jgi:2-keto-4-pentenoate hydratase